MTTTMPEPLETDRPWERCWLEAGLETLGECTVCGDMNRQLLHRDLIDNTFFSAPGLWNLWQCANCRSAYLDPRPTPETIELAYEKYYTHSTGGSKVDYPNLGFIQKFRRQLVNGYTRIRYGSPDKPAREIGFFLDNH